MTAIHKPDPVRQVAAELNDWQKLWKEIEPVAPDIETLIDTLDGETNLKEALLDVAELVQTIEGELISGVDARLKQLEDRKARLKNSAEMLRAIILRTMEKAEIPTIQGALATLTKKATPRALDITDEAAIPSAYWAAQDPKLDRKALLAALKAGEEIEGARLDNGGITLQMRSS